MWQSSTQGNPTDTRNWAGDSGQFLNSGDFGFTDVFAVPLADGKIQLWGLLDDNQLITTWKESPDPDAGWVPPQLQDTPVGFLFAMAGRSADGKGQIWAFVDDIIAPLMTTWKASADPNAPWLPWSQMETPFNADIDRLLSLGAGNLSDGRLQLWASRGDGTMISTWKTSTQPNASWSPWSQMEPPFVGAVDITVGRLPDLRPQLWAIGRDSSLSTTWKTTTDPSSAWAAWGRMQPDPGPVVSVAVGELADGRLQLFAIQGGQNMPTIRTSVKDTPDPNAPWSDWTTFWEFSL
ncbi:MAG TPA: hypothetical protein VIX86_11045 [Streptosporangiaceae bacterium]